MRWKNQRKETEDTTEKNRKKQEANDLAEHLHIKIDDFKIKIQELEDQKHYTIWK